MLREFDTFMKSKEYRDIKIANGKKSKEVLRLKCKREQLRTWRHYSHEDERRYIEAKEEYEAPGRGGAGVTEALAVVQLPWWRWCGAG